MAKAVTYTKRALRALRGIPKPTAERIMDKVEQYAKDPASLANNVTKLTGRPEIRLRVGDWRVLIEETDSHVHVLDIGPRGDIY